MPWGQKNMSSEIIQSQTVTPPFAAMLGTTFRLNTATTKSATRSQRPSERFRWTVSVVVATGSGSAKRTPRQTEKSHREGLLLARVAAGRLKLSALKKLSD